MSRELRGAAARAPGLTRDALRRYLSRTVDSAEADSRFGPTAVRALEDAIRLAAREPRVALSQARKAVEAVALHLYAREIGDPDDAPKKLMLDELLKQLVKARQLPEGVAMHFGTVQRYGNYGAHPQADDASVGNTVAFNQPCIESLRFIARWYLKDRLRLADTEIPASVREAVFGATSPSTPPPVSTQPEPPPVVVGTNPEQPGVAPTNEKDRFKIVGTCLEGKYQIERAVAEGGFGAVYRGTHLTLEKAVAVKVLKLPTHLSEAGRAAFVESFALEAKTIARMEHPSIVKVLDFGVSPMPSGERAPWMVLDWVTGETLETQLKQRKGLGGRAPAECLEIMRPVLDAIAYAHSERIAHRDIKPANIMLTSPPVVSDTGGSRLRASTGSFGRRGEVTVKLLDFGIAKIMRPDEGEASGETKTQAAFVSFSLPYAAPEQVSGTRTGPWTDVHALALVMVELLVGTAPYQGSDAQELYMSVLSPTRPTPARFGVDVGPWEPVLARALASRPADRYASAGELLDALEAEVPAAKERTAQSGLAAPVPAVARDVAEASAIPVGQTFRGAEVPARASARSSKVALLGGGLALLTLLGIGTFAMSQTSGHSDEAPTSAPPSHPARTRPAPPPSPTAVMPELAALAPTSAAPTPTAPAPTPTALAPTPTVADAGTTPQVADTATEQPAEPNDGHHHHRRSSRHRRSDPGEPSGAPTIVAAPPVTIAPQPTRIRAD